MSNNGTATAKRLWGLEAPQLTGDASMLVMGAEGTITFPFPAFLIEHERALILFDTSFHPLASDDPKAYFGELYEVFKPITDPSHRIDRQLAKLGFRPEDVTHVVLSHGHSDHTGGLFMFPNAKFFVGPGEFAFAAAPTTGEMYFRYADEIAPVLEFDWTTITTPTFDLLGDGSITLLHTPGHTPGELTCVVELPSQRMVLTGDTVHLRAGMELMAPDPHDFDFDLARQSLAQLAGLVDAGATMWIAHDPEDWAKFKPLVAQE